MKLHRPYPIILALLFGLALAAVPAHAQGGRFGLGVRLGGAFPHDCGAVPFLPGDPEVLAPVIGPGGILYEQVAEQLGGPYDFAGPTEDYRIDPMFTLGLYGAYALQPRLHLRFGIDFYRTDVRARFPVVVEGTEPRTEYASLEAELDGFLVSLEMRHYWMMGSVSPYLGLGGRIESISSSEILGQLGGVTFGDLVDTGKTYVSPLGVAGAHVPVGRHTAVEAEVWVVGKSLTCADGVSKFVFEPEVRVALTATIPGDRRRPEPERQPETEPDEDP